MNMLKKLVVASALSLSAMSSFAAPVLSFNNANADVSHTYNLGDTIALDVWISGLNGVNGDGAGGLDLGAFDLGLSFNGGVTGYQSTAFSTDLDDSLFFGLTDSVTSSNGVNLSGVSLSWDLSTQADTFKLFTLFFTAGSVGNSSVKFDSVLLGDFDGAAMNSSSFLADINVVDNSVSVPEPSSLAIFAGALALMGLRRRKTA